MMWTLISSTTANTIRKISQGRKYHHLSAPRTAIMLTKGFRSLGSSVYVDDKNACLVYFLKEVVVAVGVRFRISFFMLGFVHAEIVWFV